MIDPADEFADIPSYEDFISLRGEDCLNPSDEDEDEDNTEEPDRELEQKDDKLYGTEWQKDYTNYDY